MIKKRFIYYNGKLIPKKEEKGTQNDNAYFEKEITFKFNNLSRNNKLNYSSRLITNSSLSNMKKSPSFQYSRQDNIINEHNINESTQTNNSFKIDKVINKTKKSSYENIKGLEKMILSNDNIDKKNNKKLKLYTQIEQLCQHIYSNSKNSYKNNVFTEMYQKENEYIKKLNNNYLKNDSLMKKKCSSRNFSRLIKHKPTGKSQSFNHYIVKSCRNDISKINKNKLIKKQNNAESHKTINIKERAKYKFEEYGIDSYGYKHPQVYKLKNEGKIKLPIIKNSKNKQIDFLNLIPTKKSINKKDNINEYLFYKVLKKNRLKKFHI